MPKVGMDLAAPRVGMIVARGSLWITCG